MNLRSLLGKSTTGQPVEVGVEAQLIDEKSHRVAPKSDQKRQLKGVGGLGKLSIGQLTKVNSHIGDNLDKAMHYLPPSQRELLARR